MTIEEIVGKLNGIAWGPWMLLLLVGTGVYLSCRVGFIQFRKYIGSMNCNVNGRRKSNDPVILFKTEW